MVVSRRRPLAGPGICLLFLTLSLLLVNPVSAAPHTGKSRLDQGWDAYDAGNFKSAATVWRELAETGHQTAQINLGALYDNGQGVKEDPTQAVRWYRAAAEAGNPNGQYNLGAMYLDGRGVPRNLETAMAWYLRAAGQQMPQAQLQIGLIYLSARETKEHAPAAPGSRFDLSSGELSEKALEWLRTYGMTCSAGGELAGVQDAMERIREIDPGHSALALLESELAKGEGTGAQATGGEDFAGSATGTGWPVSGGYVITNNHVIAGSESVVLVDTEGRRFNAWAVLRDEIHDIAFLSVADAQHLPPALPLAEDAALPGTPVFTVGYPRPDTLGIAPKLSEGAISGLNGPDSNPTLYQTTVSVQPGNSGGPLLNMRGEVVGLVTAMLALRDEELGTLQILSDASCALKIDQLKNHLGQLTPNAFAPGPAAVPSGAARMIDNVRQSTLLVVAR